LKVYQMEIQIRTASRADAAVIACLIHELAQLDGEAPELGEDFVVTYLELPGTYVLIAETGGRASGLLSCSIRPNLLHAGPICLIDELIVSESFRGQGIGSKLLDEAIRQAEAAGCVEISVSTLPDNQPAINLYRRHGLCDEALLFERHFQT
jgi:ribosomal protein S18 acetylase RimI-like enzyme